MVESRDAWGGLRGRPGGARRPARRRSLRRSFRTPGRGTGNDGKSGAAFHHLDCRVKPGNDRKESGTRTWIAGSRPAMTTN
jgi:hypothetical protein